MGRWASLGIGGSLIAESGAMKRDLFELVGKLTREGVSFVVAGQSSAQGDVAAVTADGAFHGWIGCTRPIARLRAGSSLEGLARHLSRIPRRRTHGALS